MLDVYSLGGVDTAAPTLTGPTCVATGSVPDGVAMDGAFAFVANEVGNSVTVIDPPTGLTTPAKTVTNPKPTGAKLTTHPLVPSLKHKTKSRKKTKSRHKAHKRGGKAHKRTKRHTRGKHHKRKQHRKR